MLTPIDFRDMPGWDGDDHAAALRSFAIGARIMLDVAPTTRGLGIDGEALRRLAHAVMQADPQGARRFFEQRFVPHRIEAPGFVTGYFEPEMAASLTPTPRFRIPLYRRPPELVDVADGEPEIRFAMRTGKGLMPFHDRAAIETGALAGRGLELAFLEDSVDAFFIHVQGSARLKLEQGGTLRIAFAGKSGHPYTSIGRLAVERGILPRERADKDGLEAWLKAHPGQAAALMRENRSFIFFRAAEIPEEAGPLGAAGVSLTPFRSLAVDRTLHTFHTPLFVCVPQLPDPERGGPFGRLMIAQDTGSAIVGPARGDIFFGTGKEAGSRAGRVSHAASMAVLVPRAVAGR